MWLPGESGGEKSSPLFLVLLGLLLFCSGFLLGKASAAPSMPISDGEASVPVITLPQAEIDAGDTTEQSPELHSIPEEASATEPKWNLILVNGEHPLSEDFQVPELT